RVVNAGLGAPQPGVGGGNGSGHDQHLSISLQHRETGVLIGQPAERGERNEAVCANNNQPSKAMADTWEAGIAPIGADTVLQKQVASIDVHFDAVSIEHYHAV